MRRRRKSLQRSAHLKPRARSQERKRYFLSAERLPLVRHELPAKRSGERNSCINLPEPWLWVLISKTQCSKINQLIKFGIIEFGITSVISTVAFDVSEVY